MIEFDVVDFVGSGSLESLVNQIEYSVGDPKLLVIEDRPESGICDEAAIALVLILEEWFDEQASMSDIRSNLLHGMVKLILLGLAQNTLRV